jgi:hypothetical protein
MPAQDFAGGGVHDLVDGALACHRVSLPEEIWPALGPADQKGGRRRGTSPAPVSAEASAATPCP